MAGPSQSKMFGKQGPSPWNDFSDNPNIQKMLGFVISGTTVIRSIQGVYQLNDGSTWLGERRGGSPQNTNVITFPQNAHVSIMEIRSGDAIDQVLFEISANGTNLPINRYGPYGGNGGSFDQVIMSNLVAFFGSDSGINGVICSLGFYFNPPS